MQLTLIKKPTYEAELTKTNEFVKEKISFETRFAAGDSQDETIMRQYFELKKLYVKDVIEDEFDDKLINVKILNNYITVMDSFYQRDQVYEYLVTFEYYYDKKYESIKENIFKIVELYLKPIDLTRVSDDKLEMYLKRIYTNYLNAQKAMTKATFEINKELEKRLISPDYKIDWAFKEKLHNYDFFKETLMQSIAAIEYRIHESGAKIYKNIFRIRAKDPQARLSDFKPIFESQFRSGSIEYCQPRCLILKSRDLEKNTFKVKTKLDSVKVTTYFEGELEPRTLKGIYVYMLLHKSIWNWYFNYIREEKNLIYSPMVTSPMENVLSFSNMTSNPKGLIKEEQVLFTPQWLDEIITDEIVANNKEALYKSLDDQLEAVESDRAFKYYAKDKFVGLSDFEFDFEQYDKQARQIIDQISTKDIRKVADTFKRVLHYTVGNY